MKKLLIIIFCIPIFGFGQDDCGKKPKYKGNIFQKSNNKKEYLEKLRFNSNVSLIDVFEIESYDKNKTISNANKLEKENDTLDVKPSKEADLMKNVITKFTKESAISTLEEKKKLLELELITQDEYNTWKDKLKKFII